MVKRLLSSYHVPFGVVEVCRVPLDLITIPSARAMPTVVAVFFLFGLGGQVAYSPKLEWFFQSTCLLAADCGLKQAP